MVDFVRYVDYIGQWAVLVGFVLLVALLIAWLIKPEIQGRTTRALAIRLVVVVVGLIVFFPVGIALAVILGLAWWNEPDSAAFARNHCRDG